MQSALLCLLAKGASEGVVWGQSCRLERRRQRCVANGARAVQPLLGIAGRSTRRPIDALSSASPTFRWYVSCLVAVNRRLADARTDAPLVSCACGDNIVRGLWRCLPSLSSQPRTYTVAQQVAPAVCFAAVVAAVATACSVDRLSGRYAAKFTSPLCACESCSAPLWGERERYGINVGAAKGCGSVCTVRCAYRAGGFAVCTHTAPPCGHRCIESEGTTAALMRHLRAL